MVSTDALAQLGQIVEHTSFQHAVQLLTPAAVMAQKCFDFATGWGSCHGQH